MFSNQLQKQRNKALYITQSQKLDMHYKNFDSDPNTVIRWNW
jgi:hypothetical protein